MTDADAGDIGNEVFHGWYAASRGVMHP